MNILIPGLRILLLCLVIPLTSHAVSATKPVKTTPGWHERQLTVDNQARYFRYYIPKNIKQDASIVLVFHGGTQSMNKIFRKRAGGSQEWQNLADEYGFLLIAPNGTNVKNGNGKGDRQNWNDCRIPIEGTNSASMADDVGFVDQLLDWANKNFSVDPNKVYVTGASNGGMMSLRLVTELSDRITAAAIFIANQPVKSDCTAPKNPVPLLMMMATEDPLMPWNGGQISGKGPQMMSAIDTRDFWLTVNRADVKNVQSKQLPDINKKDDSIIYQSIYPATENGQPLWFYEIRGAGHTMPSIQYKVPFIARMLVGSQNKDIEATHEAWDFLKRFSK